MSEVQKLVVGDSILERDIVIRKNETTKAWTCQCVSANRFLSDVIGTHPSSASAAYMDWHSTSMAIAIATLNEHEAQRKAALKEIKKVTSQFSKEINQALWRDFVNWLFKRG